MLTVYQVLILSFPLQYVPRPSWPIFHYNNDIIWSIFHVFHGNVPYSKSALNKLSSPGLQPVIVSANCSVKLLKNWTVPKDPESRTWYEWWWDKSPLRPKYCWNVVRSVNLLGSKYKYNLSNWTKTQYFNMHVNMRSYLVRFWLKPKIISRNRYLEQK